MLRLVPQEPLVPPPAPRPFLALAVARRPGLAQLLLVALAAFSASLILGGALYLREPSKGKKLASTPEHRNTAIVPVPRSFENAKENLWMEKHYNLTHSALGCTSAGRVMFYGDSITARWDTDVFRERFGARYGALNFGIGGDRTQHLLWRLQNGEVACPDTTRVVVMLIGTNNVPRASPVSGPSPPALDVRNTPWEIVEGILVCVNEVKRAYPLAKILLLALFPRGKKFSPERKAVNAVNALVADLLREVHEGGGKHGSRIRFMDVSHVFMDSDQDVEATMPDLLHPMAESYVTLADELVPVIDELLEEAAREDR